MPVRFFATLALMLTALFAPPVPADDFSLYAGVWDYGVRGDIAEQGSTVSLDSDGGGLKVNPQMQLLLRYDYVGGWWPDLSLGYAHLGGTGAYLANSSFQIGGIGVVSGRTTVQAAINLNDFNASFDWRLVYGPRLRVEAGVEAKYLGGHASIVGSTRISAISLPIGQPLVEETDLSLNEPVPLAHLRAEARPWPWLRLELSGGIIAYAGDHAAELRAVADLHIWQPVYITAGYQEQDYKVKDNPYVVDARIDGPTLGITVATP
jgi:hypothetical protein